MTEIRFLGPADLPALSDLFGRLPDGELAFFKEDVRDPQVVQALVDDGGSRRLAAIENGRIVGYAAILPRLGWSSHVGEVRLAVDAEHRRRGVGRLLARGALLAALDLGLKKLVVEVMADQVPAVTMFQSLGFTGEALLCDHVRIDGELRDLLVLAHHVEEAWAEMSQAGLEEGFT